MTAPDAAGERALRFSAAACVGIAVVLWMGPFLVRRDLFNGDAAHHVFWLYRYADPSLFPRDLSIGYFASVSPWGYRAFYAALVPFVDALLAAEVVSVFLLLVSGVLAWHLGKSLVPENRPLAGLLACATMLLLLPVRDLLPAMGLERAFALPITLLCLWALVARRYAWVGLSWLAAALFYPIIVPGLGLTGGIVLLADFARERRLPPYSWWNAALGCAAMAIVLLGAGTPDGVGPMVTYEQARTMPEFSPRGRQELFGTTWTGYWFTHHRTGLGWSPRRLLTIAAAVLAAVLSGGSALIPRPAWALVLTGASLWAAARLWLFHLYLPERHLRWAMAAFVVVAFTAAGWAIVSTVSRRARLGPVAMGRVRWAIALAAPLVVLRALLPSATRAWQTPVDLDLERAYAFLASLPTEAVVAAHPDLADYVPVRTRHSVLASTEGAHAYMVGYYARVRPRIEASLRAAYATSWRELDDVLTPYGVDVVLTAPSVWAREEYYAPYNDLVEGLLAGGRQEGFVLAKPTGDRVLFRSGEVYVIRVASSRSGPA
ncbi:MAG: hypothetical protein ACREOF_03925 [Gemmatimonadales bacterium]